jgi:hypothetical protein
MFYHVLINVHEFYVGITVDIEPLKIMSYYFRGELITQTTCSPSGGAFKQPIKQRLRLV